MRDIQQLEKYMKEVDKVRNGGGLARMFKDSAE